MRSTAAAFLLLASQALAATVNFTMNVRNSVEAPDGLPRDSIIAGQFGGVPIVVNKGDFVNINVTNTLTSPTMRRSTSIHWYGDSYKTNSEDGPSFVNQCPISPNSTYIYSFSTGNQSGTFWYHSHLATQYADGQRGTFVIYDPEDPLAFLYDVDDAGTIITLADWYHGFAEALMDEFIADGQTPVPGSGLFNGIGRYIGGPAIPWAVVTVEQGKRYRFRVIDISAFAAYTVSVDQHLMAVIEIDGIETVPLLVTNFMIHAAQRYSFVLNATQPVGNYWFRAPMTLAGSSAQLDKENVKGILRYVGAPDEDPTTSEVITLVNPGAPGGDAPADHVIDLKFNSAGNGVWEINGISYTPPDLPTLLKIVNGATLVSDFNVSEHTFVLKDQEVVELHIHGSDHGITHPFHLHGHAFDIVQSASGPPNFINPPRRDVIGVEQGGVVIRFRADNPGPWFLHCHIDWHLEAGLAVVFAESPPENREGPQAQIIKQEWLELCPAYHALPPGKSDVRCWLKSLIARFL
ncbi:laccase [Mycena amicta]|nr:laccase [Mycena amicta]